MVYKYFDKILKGTELKNSVTPNQQLPDELHKPVIRKYKKRKYIHILLIKFSNLILFMLFLGY